ncbi:class I SAM-dependent methyltransferase [Rhodococcus tukisamuensis]|uniref:Cyclopropane-fatty-acyl-phospholipid synthase n=1 Tax=Rhodococcus tukisamuensis TaxID=168276 RepID=A0A1G6VJ79_9NOCA|nr:cyclopropane-fatty-acyl-phospholipid synthase family protein [Rhodococcus tukisamuensis]SDD53618.1 cyclopropane-fatty-acyl-phospholipid synthase [Rhodococcus tukisamuensis]
MTTSGTENAARALEIDANRWPGIAHVRTDTFARAAGAVADRLFRRAASRLAVRVEYPDGTVLGTDGTGRILPRMIIHRPEEFARRLGTGGLVGFGESYMAGDWASPEPAAVLTPFAAEAATLIPRPLQWLRPLVTAKQPAAERNTPENTRSNISRHYDLSNELFELFLDRTMSYSSALFDDLPARWDMLAVAQHRKIDRLLDAARVGPGTRLVEIGTGWGELGLRAAARGAQVRSVTLSREQQLLARRRVADAGLSDSVKIDLLDYRAVTGDYDAIVSVEMIEAVGFDYWPTYFRTLDRLLVPGGRVALQAITMPHDRMSASRNTYTWVHKYIFPGGLLPSTRAIDDVTRRETSLRVVDRFAMGAHYAETLRLWRERFAAQGAEVTELGFDDVFRRMWEFYLAYSEAGFRAGYLDVQQFVFEKDSPR